MLGGEDLVPVAGGGFHALHQRLATVVRGKADRDAGERGAESGPALSPHEKALRLSLIAAGCCSMLAAVRAAVSGSMSGFGYALP